MLLVARHDLIVACQRQPADHLRDALGRGGGERDVGGIGPERLRVGAAELLAELTAALEVLLCAPPLELAPELALGRADRARGQGAVGPRVQICRGSQHGKLLAQPRQAHKPRE